MKIKTAINNHHIIDKKCETCGSRMYKVDSLKKYCCKECNPSIIKRKVIKVKKECKRCGKGDKMYKINDEVIISVKKDNVLYDFNGEDGKIVDVTEDLFRHKLYVVDVNGNKVLAFDCELKGREI